MNFKACGLAAALATSSVYASAQAPDFFKQVTEISQQYQQVQEAANELLNRPGELAAANNLLLKAVPEAQQTPAHHFALGSLFYDIAPDLSEKYHAKVIQALPEEPYANLEWAMILQRKGEYQKAAEHYRKTLPRLEGHHLIHTLLADCLMRTGALAEAVKQWNLADHPSNHTGIDFDIHAIYGELSPYSRHQKLWEAIAGGDSGKLDELVALAANWNKDWWNVSRNESLLKADLEKAKEVLGETNTGYQELILYADTQDRGKVDPQWLKSRLEAMGLVIGEKSSLPESHLVTDHLFSLVMHHKLASGDELLKKHGPTLEARSRALDTAGITSLNALAVLILAAEKPDFQRLAQINLMGWEKHRDPRFAASLLIGLLKDQDTAKFAETLPRALADFPENTLICTLALQHAKENGKLTTEDIVRCIKAEYRLLSVGMAIRDSYRLKGLFALLEDHLATK